jgi:hypothetical protein
MLVGLSTDSDARVTIWHSSEVHYILEPDETFATVEFAVSTDRPVRQLLAWLHGRVLSGEQASRGLAKRNIRQLLEFSDCNLDLGEGVHEFQDTWHRVDLPTNKAYEGEPARIFRDVKLGTADSIYLMGCMAMVPPCRYTIDSQYVDSSEHTIIKIDSKGGSDFAADQLYAFRIGVLMERPSTDKTWSRRFALRPLLGVGPPEYPIHYLTCNPELHGIPDEVLRRLKTCKSYLTLEPYADRVIAQKARGLNEDEAQAAEHSRHTPTTDVWLVVLQSDRAFLPAAYLERDARIVAEPTPFGLFPQKQSKQQGRYKEIHAKLAGDVREYRSRYTLTPDCELHDPMPWTVELHRPSVVGFLRSLISSWPISLVALGLALAPIVASDPDDLRIAALTLGVLSIFIVFVFYVLAMLYPDSWVARRIRTG